MEGIVGQIDNPRITIIIPNLNSRMIDRTLQSILDQNYDLECVEVLVVGLDSPNLVREDKRVHLISTGHQVSPAVARNIGLKMAKGNIICFTDADCLVSPDWLTQMTAPIFAGEAEVVGGSVRFSQENYWTLVDNLSWFHEFLDSKPAGDRKILPTLNICFYRDVFDKTGYMNENFPSAGGEDAEWTTRMRQNNLHLHFIPQAYVRHCPPRNSFKDVWRHAVKYGRHSVLVNPKFSHYIKPSVFISNRWLLLTFILPISFIACSRIYMRDRSLWHLLYTFPGVFITKIAWCIGAANHAFR
ncbi:MAG: glycosyltransferase [Anaerolineales bacterium]|nr:MAG: glycosyltransferase [Anaerolineales bacterium]